MSKLESILTKISKKLTQKLDIPFEESWLYEGELVYPVTFTVKAKEWFRVYGVKKEDGTIGIALPNAGVYDTIEECFDRVIRDIKEKYGNSISDIEVGNPEIER